MLRNRCRWEEGRMRDYTEMVLERVELPGGSEGGGGGGHPPLLLSAQDNHGSH